MYYDSSNILMFLGVKFNLAQNALYRGVTSRWNAGLDHWHR